MAEAELYRKARELASETGSLYKGGIKDRENLLDFLEMNDWFGFESHINPERKILNSREKIIADEYMITELLGKLDLWFKAYKKKHSEKLELLAGFGKKKFPETTQLFMEFVERNDKCSDISSWRLLDFLLFHMDAELSGQDTEKLEVLAEKLDREAARDVSILFSDFYQWLQGRLGISGWSYRYEYRKKRDDVCAYPLREFSVMAYCIFNEEHWEKEQMLKKACDSAIYANLWIYIAMHFVCALRSTDIIRLPKPDIHEVGALVRKKILEGMIENPERFSQDVQIRIRYIPKHPNKTRAYDHVPELKVFIPQTLEKAMGIILAAAASHRDDVRPGEPFIRTDRNISHMRRFFGNVFMEALEGKGFSSSRANKSYMQGLEMKVDEGGGQPKGYMIAALARSHKGGIGTLPDATDIYLRDASFSGYRPEFIAREMFERGIFGFVPHLLLDVYAGKTYTTLTVREQTEIINAVGIRPSGIEAFVRLNEKALAKSRDVVSEILSKEQNCGSVLQRIAAGEAVGKQKGSLCVMSACGVGCAFTGRPACIGCRYEIHTKAILQQLTGEYSRMKAMVGSEDGWRYTKIIREAILPVVGEYLESMNAYSDPDEIKFLSMILEGGLKGYDNSSE